MSPYKVNKFAKMNCSIELNIFDDVRVEITCTGRGHSTLPNWSINDKFTIEIDPLALEEVGIDIQPASASNATDENDNAFQTLVINGSALINGTTIRCVFDGEVIFPSTELVFQDTLPPPENLNVSEGGLVQWQPPYSSDEDGPIRYFLYNVYYSVEVTDTEVESKVASLLTNDTSFVFLPPLECVEYVVSVRALSDNSEGDPAEVTVPPTRDFEIPEQVKAHDVNVKFIQSDILSVAITGSQNLMECNGPTVYSIVYNEQQRNVSATNNNTAAELSVHTEREICFLHIYASNSAGTSNKTKVLISGTYVFV